MMSLRDLKPLATRRRFAGNGSVFYKKRNAVDDGFRSRPTGLSGELALCVVNFHQAASMKVPSLRNIARTAPCMHNGVFDTLEEVLDFYSDRDADGVVAEVADNVNMDELGALNLTDQEKADIIAFLRTLSDGFSE